MNRKTFLTILIGIVTLVVVGIIAFLVISFWKGGSDGTTGTGFSLFPGMGGGAGQPEDVTETPDGTVEAPDATMTDQNIPRLRRLADFPVIALQSYTRPEKIIVERIIEIPQEETSGTTSDETESEVPSEEITEEDDTLLEEEGVSEPLTETIVEVVDINQLYARYVRQDDGAVFTSKIANQLSQKQTTIGPIPYAGDSAIGNYGNSIVYRFFNDNSQTIETFVGAIVENNIPETVCAAPFREPVTSDSDKNTIILLQEFLAYNLDQEITENGLFGNQTRQALRDFQIKEGITVATSANQATIDAINNRCITIIEAKVRAQNPIEMTGVFLTENIVAMSVSPNSERLVYFTQKGENTIAVTLDFATRALKQIFTSPFSEWAPYWTNPNKITLHTKPSGLVNGFLYSLDVETGFLHKYDDQIPGLSGIISPSAEKIFISGSANNIIVNKVLDTTTGEDPIVSLKTLPEKCVWSNDAINIYCAVPDFIGRGLYPDDWYKGKVVFSDSIWSLNTTTGETRQIADLSREGGQSFDVTKPSLEANELYMLFINKTTGEPWILEL